MAPTTPPARRSDSRLTGFSDAVFALSATLLVVTLQVPDSYQALLDAVAGFPAFAIAFGLLMLLWYQHRQLFRSYPMDDALTVAINGVLLFVVLLYVYPLKLLSEIFAWRFLGAAPGAMGPIEIPDVQGLFIIFGAGWIAVYASYAALHGRAWLAREELGLDELGRFEVVQDALAYVVLVVAGLLSILLAVLGVGLDWGLPGLPLLLTPVATMGQALVAEPRRKELKARRLGDGGR